MQVRLLDIYVKVEYQGHGVKVKVRREYLGGSVPSTEMQFSLFYRCLSM